MAVLNEALRDRLVCGLRAGNITKRLLAEAKLTLEKAIEIATAMEAIAKDAVEFQQQLHVKPETSVHKFGAKSQPASTSSCYRCGKSGHSPNQCHFKDATCHGCNKKGHTSDQFAARVQALSRVVAHVTLAKADPKAEKQNQNR